MAMPLRCARANISSGSSDPSICRCSSALGRPAMKAARSSREAKPSAIGGHPFLAEDDRRLGLVTADFFDRQPLALVREDQPAGGLVDMNMGRQELGRASWRASVGPYV